VEAVFQPPVVADVPQEVRGQSIARLPDVRTKAIAEPSVPSHYR
jgi:hypothetical protein